MRATWPHGFVRSSMASFTYDAKTNGDKRQFCSRLLYTHCHPTPLQRQPLLLRHVSSRRQETRRRWCTCSRVSTRRGSAAEARPDRHVPGWEWRRSTPSPSTGCFLPTPSPPFRRSWRSSLQPATAEPKQQTDLGGTYTTFVLPVTNNRSGELFLVRSLFEYV